MTVTGHALAMRLKLKQLAAQHRHAPQPITIPLQPPTQHPMMLAGFAATTDRDRERTQLRGWAFGYPLPDYCRRVPLLWRHDPAQPCGEITDMDYAEDGSLCIRCEVTHELARRAGGFSIEAKVHAYEMRDTDGPDYWALITSATLTGVSITDRPSNPFCLVHERHRVSAAAQHYALMAQRVAKLSELVTFIKQENSRHATL